MKLIIDIDEDIYKMVCITGTFGRFRFNTAKAIKNGIPLKEELENIKAEIKEEKLDVDLDIGNETIYNNAINDVLAILDKHTSELKGE